jgi:hypothetical protein
MGAALCALVFACSRIRHDPELNSTDPAILIATNHGNAPIVLFAFTGNTSPWRIGSIPGNTSETFTLPPAVVAWQKLELLARPTLGGQGFAFAPINLVPGDTIDVSLENSLIQSTATSRH